MGIIMLLFGVGLFCLVIWRALTYVVPIYLGLAAAIWSFWHGAGAGAVIAGLVVGAVVLFLSRYAFQSNHLLLRWTVALLFVLPAGYAGYCAASEVATIVVPSPLWQNVLSALAGLCDAATAHVRLQEPAFRFRAYRSDQALPTRYPDPSGWR